MKWMEKLYDNLDEAKAFVLSFTNFVYTYDDLSFHYFIEETCSECGNYIQVKDYRMPKAQFKKPYALLDTLEMGVSPELREELIASFDVTEEDFRPIINKRGDLVYYQITPRHVMLPLAKENGWSMLPPCRQCGSVVHEQPIDHENDKGEPFYYISREALNEMHDFNVTFEQFRFHMPKFVISRRVYDYLVERYPRTHYFPMFLKER